MKRFLASLLIAIIAYAPVSLAYVDVPNTHPNFYGIEYLRRNDVFQNSRYFRPDVLISKAEFIKYLVKLNSPDFRIKQGRKINLPFEDTNNSAWYAPYFEEAIKAGILSERETYVNPNKKLTLFEALELLFHSRSIPIPKRYKGTVPYTDVAKNKRVIPLIMRAIELEVIDPESSTKVGIYKRISRADAAQMIYKMDLVELGRDPLFVPSSEVKITATSDQALKKIMDVWGLITSNYLNHNDLDLNKMSDAAIRTIVEELGDPYSTYLDQEENAAFADELEGDFDGIGAYLEIDENGRIIIVSPIQDSPAEKAGIKAGDIIKKIDDVSTEDMTIFEAVSRIKGPKGTTVKLTVQRNGGQRTIPIVRDRINIAAVENEFIENGQIAHVKILQFSQSTVSEFADVVKQIKADPKVKGMILDVRNNPGGLLNSAINLSSYFLDKGLEVVDIAYNFFNYKQYSRGRNELVDFPLVVLVNKGSASASEIVAGALQDNERAKIIGETTFGKGTVQEINYFSDNSSLKITVAKWLTPNGISIQDNGIKPDITVVNPKEGNADPQLNRAISELKKIF